MAVGSPFIVEVRVATVQVGYGCGREPIPTEGVWLGLGMCRKGLQVDPGRGIGEGEIILDNDGLR